MTNTFSRRPTLLAGCLVALAVFLALATSSPNAVVLVEAAHPLSPYCRQNGMRNVTLGSNSRRWKTQWRSYPLISRTFGTRFYLRCFSWVLTPLSSSRTCSRYINSTRFTIDSKPGIATWLQKILWGKGKSTSIPIKHLYGGSLMASSYYYNFYGYISGNIRYKLPRGCKFNLIWSWTAYRSYSTPIKSMKETAPWIKSALPMVMMKNKRVIINFRRWNRNLGSTIDSLVLVTPQQYCNKITTKIASKYPKPTNYRKAGSYQDFTWILQKGIPNAGYYYICIKPAGTSTWVESGYIDVHGNNPAYFMIHENSTVRNGNQVKASKYHTLLFYGVHLDLRPNHDTAKAVSYSKTCLSGRPQGVSTARDLGPTDDFGYNVTVAHWRVKLPPGSFKICYKRHGHSWTRVHFYDQVPPLTQERIKNLDHLHRLYNRTIPDQNRNDSITWAPATPLPPGQTAVPTAILDPTTLVPPVSTMPNTSVPTWTSVPNTTAAPNTSVPTLAPNTSAPATAIPVTSAPNTSAPVTAAPNTSAPVTSAPNTSAPMTSAPNTLAPVTAIPVTSAPNTSAPATAIPVTAAPNTSAPATAIPVTAAPNTSAPATAIPVTAAPNTSAPATAIPLTAAPDTSAPATAIPVTAVPDTSAPATAIPVTAVPDTSAPVTSVPATAIPVTAAPDTSAPATAIPVTAAPDTSAPATAIPVTAVPDTSAPVTSVPATAIPVTAAPDTSAPVTSAPDTSAPVTSVPVTAIPVTAAPDTSAPATASPVTSAPDTSAPVTSVPVTAAPPSPVPSTMSPGTSAPLTPDPTSAPIEPPTPCHTGTVPADWEEDESVKLNRYVSLKMSHGVFNAKSFRSTVAEVLCLDIINVALLSTSPEKIADDWILNVSITCSLHDEGCDTDERMQYLLYLMSGKDQQDVTLRTDLGVSSAQTGLASAHDNNNLQVEDDSLTKQAGILALIIIGAVAVIILMIVAAILFVRRKKRRDAYRNHMDFTPDHPSPDTLDASSRPGFADVEEMDGTVGSMVAFGAVAAGAREEEPGGVVMEVNDVEIVEGPKKATDDPDYY